LRVGFVVGEDLEVRLARGNMDPLGDPLATTADLLLTITRLEVMGNMVADPRPLRKIMTTVPCVAALPACALLLMADQNLAEGNLSLMARLEDAKNTILTWRLSIMVPTARLFLREEVEVLLLVGLVVPVPDRIL
jgi:hypothetical protein